MANFRSVFDFLFLMKKFLLVVISYLSSYFSPKSFTEIHIWREVGIWAWCKVPAYYFVADYCSSYHLLCICSKAPSAWIFFILFRICYFSSGDSLYYHCKFCQLFLSLFHVFIHLFGKFCLNLLKLGWELFLLLIFFNVPLLSSIDTV